MTCTILQFLCRRVTDHRWRKLTAYSVGVEPVEYHYTCRVCRKHFWNYDCKNAELQKLIRSAGGAVLRGDVGADSGKGKLRTGGGEYIQEFTGYPKNLLRVPKDPVNNYHPTQKPVALLEYLIRTYTNEDEMVLDFAMGGGSTGVACINTGRKFIGIELDENYFNIAKGRIEEAQHIVDGREEDTQDVVCL